MSKDKNLFERFKEFLGSQESPAQDSFTVANLLHGVTPGTMQTVGLMQVIPLVSELDDERFVSPAEASVSTETYGSLYFENPTPQLLIVPCHTGYVVKEKAQDHAMAHLGLVPAQKSQSFDTAICIQQTQGGLISHGQHKMVILPFVLRERALEVRDEKSFNKLWDSISQFNGSFGLSQVGNLVEFLRHYEKELDEFVAEFECVPGQVGAIVLINGEVIGIERTPSARYWASVWQALIRECYGSYALAVAEQNKEQMPSLETRVFLRSENIHSLEDLEAALAEARQQEEEVVREKIRELLAQPFSCHKEKGLRGFTVETVNNERFVGQILREGQRVCYASLILSQAWSRQREWQKAPPFSI